MNELSQVTGSNYMRIDKEPIGVFRILKQKNIRDDFGRYVRSVTSNFYIVRVDSRNGITSVAKRKTREEAEEIFRKYMPYWEGAVPYYERMSERLKKKYKI